MPAIRSKSQTEVIPIKFNFSAVVTSILSTTIIVSVRSGVDSNPNDMKEGSPIIDDGSVIQYIKGGINGNTYNITCAASSGLAVYELNAILPIKASE